MYVLASIDEGQDYPVAAVRTKIFKELKRDAVGEVRCPRYNMRGRILIYTR